MEIKYVFSPALLSQQQREIWEGGDSEWKGTLFAEPHVSKVEDIQAGEKNP